MKTVLLLGVSLLLATVVAMPAASADMAPPCGDGSVVNRVQECANNAIDWTQETAEEVFCSVVCNW